MELNNENIVKVSITNPKFRELEEKARYTVKGEKVTVIETLQNGYLVRFYYSDDENEYYDDTIEYYDKKLYSKSDIEKKIDKDIQDKKDILENLEIRIKEMTLDIKEQTDDLNRIYKFQKETKENLLRIAVSINRKVS